MSNLSNRDFFKEIGNNILLYPFNGTNIKGASINLSVSDYAWNINDNKRLQIIVKEKKRYLLIPASTPVIISTLEAIYVTSRVCGTYHTKVSWASRGLGYISTTLDPEYFGVSLIGITNNSDKDLEIEIGETFVTLMFNHLPNETLQSMVYRPNNSNQSDVIARYEDGDHYLAHLRDLGYLSNPESLKNKLVADSGFVEWRRTFAERDADFQRQIKKIRKRQDRSKILLKFAAGLLMYFAIAPLLVILFVFLIDIFSNWLVTTPLTYNEHIDINGFVSTLTVAIFVSLLAASVAILSKVVFPNIDRRVGEINGKQKNDT